MEKILSWFLMIFLITGIGFSEETSSKAKEVFKEVYEKILSSLPSGFSAELKGESIEKKLKSIPKDSYIDKNKRIYLDVNYSKSEGISFVVRNADELYKDLFKNLPKQIFAFDLLFSKNTNIFEKYEVKIELEDEKNLILSLSPKKAENKGIIYYDKSSGRVMRIDYQVGTDLLSTTIVMYKSINGFQIPYKFITKEVTREKSTLPEIYELDNIRIR